MGRCELTGLICDRLMSTETMALTHENVGKVLDELRPFLMADGGNVEVELDGLIVKVRSGRRGAAPAAR